MIKQFTAIAIGATALLGNVGESGKPAFGSLAYAAGDRGGSSTDGSCSGSCGTPDPTTPATEGGNNFSGGNNNICFGSFESHTIAKIEFNGVTTHFSVTNIGLNQGKPLGIGISVSLNQPATIQGCNKRFQRNNKPS